MYQGGCLCGAARFESGGPIRNIVCCHCSHCRKAQGSAFAASKANWEDISGELPQYESCEPGRDGI